jgi:uncharacterized membrane protein
MVAAQVALSFGVLMAVLAVVTDGGILLVERRHAQATADAAALAAASVLYSNPDNVDDTARATALQVASDNGYINDAVTPVVPNHPPISGLFANDPWCAEVTVTRFVPRGFSGILGGGSIPVSARAVARGAPPVIMLCE